MLRLVVYPDLHMRIQMVNSFPAGDIEQTLGQYDSAGGTIPVILHVKLSSCRHGRQIPRFNRKRTLPGSIHDEIRSSVQVYYALRHKVLAIAHAAVAVQPHLGAIGQHKVLLFPAAHRFYHIGQTGKFKAVVHPQVPQIQR